MTDTKAGPNAVQQPSLIEQSEFEANIDYCLDAAENGMEFRLVREGVVLCHLIPAAI
jgi:hypothetical protein